MQLRQQFADVNGIRLHYMESGSNDAPLILFAHGFPEFWYEWHLQLQEFGRDFHAVAPDLRGYNLSSKPQEVEAYRTKTLVEDLRALAATLTDRPFTLVGHDWGGAVCWAFAIQHPELLHRLIILNSPHPAVFARELATNPAQQRASQYMRLFQSPEAEDIVSAANFRMLREAALPGRPEEEVAKYVEAWSQPGAITGGLNYYRAMKFLPPALDGEGMKFPGVEPSSMQVRVPTRVIWGMRDTALTPGNLEGLEAFVPGVDIVPVPDATHWIVYEKPQLVNQRIREFLGS
jgi:epoxide hydrolase 4